MRTLIPLFLLFLTAIVPGVALTPGYWHTLGNQVVDSHNQTVRMAGVNWYGFEMTTGVALGLRKRGYKHILHTIADNGYNVIRLPFSNEMVEHPIIPSNEIDYNNGDNRDLKGLNSLQVLDRIVNYAGYLGLRIVLDNHRSSAGDNTENGLWYTAAYPESNWIADWQTLAKRYRGSPIVIGFDLRNELNGAGTGGSCWDCGSPSNDWHLAAQRAGNAVPAINAHLLIFVEGTDCYKDDCGWWGGNLQGVRQSPVVLNVPDQLVYSVHDYGPNVYKKRFFNRSTTYASLVALWTRLWAYVSLDGIAPVWIGEFGTPNNGSDIQSPVAGSQGQWFQSMVSFLQSQPRIGWSYWTLNGEDGYGLLAANYDSIPANPVKHLMLASIQGGPVRLGRLPPVLAAPTILPAVTLFANESHRAWSAGAADIMYAGLMATAFSWPDVQNWPSWWKLVYLAFAILVPATTYNFFNKHKVGNEAQNAAATWGVICFALLTAFYLGASSNTKQFLVLFGNGVLGAAFGYLVGVWLAPSSTTEEVRFDKARNLVGTLLAGVVGTKLLSMWDSLTKGDTPLIFQADYYLPFASVLVGFFVSLAAFYTLRGSGQGNVRISVPKDRFFEYALNGTTFQNGLRAGSVVKFSGAADCEDDLSVLWELKPPALGFDFVPPANILSADGILTAPSKETLDAWVQKYKEAALVWQVVARSNQDRAKTQAFEVRFCRDEKDCPPVPGTGNPANTETSGVAK